MAPFWFSLEHVAKIDFWSVVSGVNSVNTFFNNFTVFAILLHQFLLA